MIDISTLQGNPRIRYGWYLRPSLAMSEAQIRIHTYLERQYGMIGGGVFMPHATIKGFFRSDASVDEMVAACDRAIQGHHAYTAYNAGPVSNGKSGIMLNIHQNSDGSVNMAQQKLHESIFQAILPLVHPECDFTHREWAMERFFAHLTLSMSDMPEAFFEEIISTIQEVPTIGPSTFLAEYFHLFAFASDDWAGQWWHTLEWKLLHGWRLPQP
jgi:hypothetical protein